jgi:hypothetical protein
MQGVGLQLQAIPNQRRVRTDTDLRQFMAADQKALLAGGAEWVRRTAQQALDEALHAGNPHTYTVGINGTTSATGKLRQGFQPGTIAQANNSVRVEFIGRALSEIANGLKPILAEVIASAFPNSPTKSLQRDWSWWVQKDRYAEGSGGKQTVSRRLGASVPETVGIYDVLWLVPDAGPARYAWIANRNAFAFIATNVIKKRTGGYKARRRLRGYLAEATRKMRGKKTPGITIQGWFVKKTLTGPQSGDWRYGVPAIRVAFKSGLARPITV